MRTRARTSRRRSPSRRRATQTKAAPKGQKTARGTKPKKETSAGKKTTKYAAERSNKKAEVFALIKRARGVTLAEIMETTGWQKHTVRGFISTLGSKAGEKIESTKNAAGERTYRIAK